MGGVAVKREILRGKPLQTAIIAEAQRQGWLVAHFYAVESKNRGWVTPCGANGKGFPDLLCVRERVLAIEVKGDGDSMKPDQKKWQQAFNLAAGTQFVVATPAKWLDGTIDGILRAREVVDEEGLVDAVTNPVFGI